MRRAIPSATLVDDESDDMPGALDAVGLVPGPTPIRTEYRFELPIGYLDEKGTLHRTGMMRMATARDELLPLSDARLQHNPAYLSVILLSRVVTRLGTLSEVDEWLIEHLFAADLAFLQDLYRRINQEGHTRAAVACPSCAHAFTVDVAGSGQGGS